MLSAWELACGSLGFQGFTVGLINNEAAAILLGNGDGTCGSSSASFVSTGDPTTSALAAADFNADGKLDLAVADSEANTVTLLLGNCDGTFTQASGSPYPVGNGPYQLATADFNRDGKMDLAVGNLVYGTVSILLQL